MSPHGCQKMSAKPCKRDAEESLPVRSLSNRKPKPPNCLLIQDKTFYSLGPDLLGQQPQGHTLGGECQRRMDQKPLTGRMAQGPQTLGSRVPGPVDFGGILHGQ